MVPGIWQTATHYQIVAFFSFSQEKKVASQIFFLGSFREMTLLYRGLAPLSPEWVLASGAWCLIPASVRDISTHGHKEVSPLGVQAIWGLETGECGAASSILRGGPGSASHPFPEQGFEFLV